MCGITGWIDWERDLTHHQSIIDDMVVTLANRGPDTSSKWVSKEATLGHRRLIVVDPEGGCQPMIRWAGERMYVMVYNGELYNTQDLRNDLELRGHTFGSHSDTEVLLASYLEWGPECVEHLNGIFAFAIWNPDEQSLFMSRDRLGVKPLFFTKQGSAFVFGSELKSLLANPLVKPVIDSEGLAEIFAIGPARTPGHGVFKHVEELRPGHSLIYHRDQLKVYPYWTLESKPHEDDFDTTVEKVRWLVTDAIERQLIADVPVVTLLSGGLDSSAISSIASQYMKKKGMELHTYSIDYVDNDRNFKASDFQPNADAPFIKKMVEYLGSTHHDIVIDTPQLVDALMEAMRARDLPGMADVDSSLVLFSHAIKQDATVALSGESADEVFGGYPWFHRPELLNANTFPWATKSVAIRDRVLSRDVHELVKPQEYIAQRYQQALAEVPRLSGESSADARLREMFYLNLTRWMPTLLDRKDRMSMAAGLEVRVPYTDHRLVEYVWNIPREMKFVDNMSKGLLRKALEGVLPEEIIYRKKSPYPKTHNPNYLSMTRKMVEDLLTDSTSPVMNLLDKSTIKSIVQDSYSSTPTEHPWFGQLMGTASLFAYIVQVDTWMREYKVQVI